jgi:hypothetical protein
MKSTGEPYMFLRGRRVGGADRFGGPFQFWLLRLAFRLLGLFSLLLLEKSDHVPEATLNCVEVCRRTRKSIFFRF